MRFTYVAYVVVTLLACIPQQAAAEQPLAGKESSDGVELASSTSPTFGQILLDELQDIGASMFGYDLSQVDSLVNKIDELAYVTIFAPVDSVWRKYVNSEGEDDSSIGLQVYIVNEELDFDTLSAKNDAFTPLSGCNTFGTEKIDKIEDRLWLVDYTGSKVVVK